MKRLPFLLFFCVFLPVSLIRMPEISGQTYHFIAGDAIRISAQKYFSQRKVRLLIGLQCDTVLLQFSTGKGIHLPAQQIQKLEGRQGMPNHIPKGTLSGTISEGLGIGGVWGLIHSPRLNGWIIFSNPKQAFAWRGVRGNLVGSTVGANIGNGTKSTCPGASSLDAMIVSHNQPELSLQKSKEGAAAHYRRSQISRRKRWQISFTLGTSSHGPATDIEFAMKRDGWGDTVPRGWFGGPTEHPLSHTGFAEIGVPWTAQIAYVLNNNFESAVLVSRVPMGFTSGYHADPERFLRLNYYSTVISPQFIFKISSIWQLGLGPAWVMNEIKQEFAGVFVHQELHHQFGIVLLTTMRYPAQSKFYVLANIQYRWVPTITFGPFKDEYPDSTAMELHAFQANFSHVFAGLGVGIRF